MNKTIYDILLEKPKDTKVWSDVFGEAVANIYEDSTDSNFPITVEFSNGLEDSITKDGYWFDDVKGISPCIVPSKTMRDWSKFAWKKGDLLMSKNRFFCIFDKFTGDSYNYFIPSYLIDKTTKLECLSTKQPTLEWTLADDSAKKIYEELTKKKKSSHKFKAFDKVLIRDSKNDKWIPALFAGYSSDQTTFEYGCITGGITICYSKYCIPYNSNTEKLIGTTIDYNE